MKRVVVQANVFGLIAGLSVFFAGVAGAPQSAKAVGAADGPHRIGLIDMARVFKNYKKFDSLREELKGDLTKSEERFKQMADIIRKENEELKVLKQGTDEYAQKEKSILGHTTQAETFRKTQQRDLIRREAQIYKQIYLEVQDAVQKYASHFNYTLILRFSSDELEPVENPEEVMRGLNKQVVYYRPSEDITNAIVNYLNQKYQRTAAAPASTENGGTARQ